MKTDNPYSNYHECIYLFKQIGKKLDLQLEPQIKHKHKHNTKLPMRSNFFTKGLIKLIFTLALLSFYGCTKAQFQEKKYTIKKGGQYSNTPYQIVGNKLEYQIKFDKTAIYKIDSVNQYDINKLFGMSACNSLHHENSARFGWRYVNGQLEIHAYIYDMFTRSSQVIDTIKIGVYNKYSITNTGTEYIFTLNEKTYVHTKSNNCKSKFNIALWPYFGGNVKAPHTMYFYFKK